MADMPTFLQRTLLRMTDPLEARDFAGVRAFRPGVSVEAGPDCLDDETLAALAEGTLVAARRPAGEEARRDVGRPSTHALDHVPQRVMQRAKADLKPLMKLLPRQARDEPIAVADGHEHANSVAAAAEHGLLARKDGN